MGGGLGSRTNDESDVRPASADEEALLDEAMQQADEWLVASLQREELRRRRRRRWALGGIAMTITVAAVVAGLVLTGGTTPAGVNQSGQAEVAQTAPPAGATDAGLYVETSDTRPVAVSESGPPKVIKTEPENGATDVDPDLKFIRVTFDQKMSREGYSWVGGGPSYPKTRGRPRWVNTRTCVLAVQLEPGHDYWLSINSDTFKNFQSAGGVAAEPYPLSFRTAGEPAGGEAPTGAPKVVEAEPYNGEVNVDPGITEIRVTFDQDMSHEGYSWVGGGPTFPEMRGKPRWVNAKTCVLPVKLEPDHEYRLSINSDRFQAFRSANGMPAEPCPISFRTGPVRKAAEAAGEASKPASLEDVRKATGLTAQGWELWRKRQYTEAEVRFAEAVKLDPESTNAWNGLGWSRFNGGDSLGGEEAFKRCVELDASHPAAQNGLGQIYFFRRQYDKAKQHWLGVAEQAPASWYGLTKTYLLEGDFEKAAKWAKKVVDQQPDDQTARKMLEAAQTKNLSSELRKLIEPPDPTQQSPETQKGWQFFNQGELPRAMAEFRKALAKNSVDANAHNGLGFCLLNSGKADEAKKHFEVCLALAPDHAGAMNGLARCLKAEGKVDEAIALWEKMVEQYPGPNAGTWGLAETYLEQKQYAKAVRCFEKLAEANPDDTALKQKLEQARAGAAGQ